MNQKPNILVIIPGGVGSGKNQGIPVLLNLFSGLADYAKLHVVSVSKIDPLFSPPNYQLSSLGLANSSPILQKLTRFRQFIKQLKTKPDLVHALWTHPHGLMAYFASRYFKVPMLNSLQGGCLADIPSLPYGGNQGLIKKILTRLMLKRADHITAETRFQKNLVPIDFQDKTSIIYYGMNEDNQAKVFKPISKQTPIKVIHVANLTPIKDQSTLIKVIHKLSENYDIHLSIIGSDYYDEQIHQLADNLAIKHRVHFLGQLPHSEVLNQLRNHDIMLHTSLYEGSCLAIIEAWSVGLCTVGTSVGMMYDLADELALVARPKDVEGLVAKMERLINHPEEQERLSAASLAWSAKHTMQDCVTSFANLYQQLLA